MKKVKKVKFADELSDCLRPSRLEDFVGQDDIKRNLKIFMNASINRKESLDHVLLYGPAGLGKTSLASIISNYMNGRLISLTAPTIEKSGDIAAVLSSIQPGDILFIDEIHALSKPVEEILYSAMEDYKINVIVREDGMPKNINFELPPFTIIGATTKPFKLSAPLRNRFGITFRLNYYEKEDIALILLRSAKVLGFKITEDGALEIAKRSRGIPRIGNMLLKRVRDFCYQTNIVNSTDALLSLKALGIDEGGLDDLDRRVLNSLCYDFSGGPVGVKSLATTLGEDEDNILELSESFLVHEGYIARTQRGRVITQKGIDHIKKRS